MILFFFFLAALFSCGGQPKDLGARVSNEPQDDPELTLLRLNPGVRFHRARIAGQIRRAIPYTPGDKLNLDPALLKFKFCFGILPEYFSQYQEPVAVKISARTGQGEEVVWSQSISPQDACAWMPVEVKLSKKPESLWLSSDVRDYGLVLTPAIGSARGKPAKPTIVFILVDALRADHLGAYGCARNTSPNIDALARSGTLFLNAQTASPFTVTSLTSFFTGMSPWEHKVIFNYNLILGENVVTLAQKMREDGYSTAGFSGTYFHLSDFGLDRGFDFFDESCAHRFFSGDAECLSANIISWVEQNPQRPLFLYFHFTPTHAPYNPPDQYKSLFSQGLFKPEGEVGQGDIERFSSSRKWYQLRRAPTQDELAWLISQYDGEIRYADDQIARVLKKLKAAGISDPLVIITADHGEGFYEHGFMEHSEELHWEVMRIPLIISGPGIPAGQRFKTFVRSYDLAPSILDYAGATALAAASGLSFRPLLRGQREDIERIGYGIIYEARNRYQISITRYPCRLLAWEPGDKNMELFNVEADPGEQNNLLSVQPEILKQLLKLAPNHKLILSQKPAPSCGQKRTRDRLKALHYLK